MHICSTICNIQNSVATGHQVILPPILLHLHISHQAGRTEVKTVAAILTSPVVVYIHSNSDKQCQGVHSPQKETLLIRYRKTPFSWRKNKWGNNCMQKLALVQQQTYLYFKLFVTSWQYLYTQQKQQKRGCYYLFDARGRTNGRTDGKKICTARSW